MSLQDREWFSEAKGKAKPRQSSASSSRPTPVKRARPVVFIHWLPGFWTGLLAGAMTGFVVGLYF